MNYISFAIFLNHEHDEIHIYLYKNACIVSLGQQQTNLNYSLSKLN